MCYSFRLNHKDATAGISQIASRFLLPLPVLGEGQSVSGETVTASLFCSDGLKTEFLGAEVSSAPILVLEDTSYSQNLTTSEKE